MNITLQSLLEAGVHFGHQVKRWNPKMKEYIYTQRKGVHIIDLGQTVSALEKAKTYIETEVANGKNIIFVGTKKQARDIIKEEAEKSGAMYINNRWPGGLISNFQSVKNTIERYNRVIAMQGTEAITKLTKKELAILNKDLERSEKLVGGIKDLKKKPDMLFVLDVKREANAIKEARLAEIPVIAICDTNSDPDLVTMAIPGNDDAMKAIDLFVKYIAEAVKTGMSKRKVKEAQKEAETSVTAKPKVVVSDVKASDHKKDHQKPEKPKEVKKTAGKESHKEKTLKKATSKK